MRIWVVLGLGYQIASHGHFLQLDALHIWDDLDRQGTVLLVELAHLLRFKELDLLVQEVDCRLDYLRLARI